MDSLSKLAHVSHAFIKCPTLVVGYMVSYIGGEGKFA